MRVAELFFQSQICYLYLTNNNKFYSPLLQHTLKANSGGLCVRVCVRVCVCVCLNVLFMYASVNTAIKVTF